MDTIESLYEYLTSTHLHQVNVDLFQCDWIRQIFASLAKFCHFGKFSGRNIKYLLKYCAYSFKSPNKLVPYFVLVNGKVLNIYPPGHTESCLGT